MKCEECSLDQASLVCEECDQLFCPKCDEFIHKGGKRRLHTRPPACFACRSLASVSCLTCGIQACKSCEWRHELHLTKSLKQFKSIAVLWDISRNTSGKFLVSDGLAYIEKRFGTVKVVQLYSDGWGRDKNNDYCVNVFRMKPSDQILLDLTILVNSGIKQILVFFDGEEEVRGKFRCMKDRRCVIKFFSSMGELAPVNTSETAETRSILMQEARAGILEFTKDEILGKIMRWHSCGSIQAKSILKSLLSSQVLRKKKYEINDLKIIYFSLKFPNFSKDLIQYIIASLNNEEISSTKQNILKKLQSVFNIKLEENDWKSLKYSNFYHKRSASLSKSSENFYAKKGKICLNGKNYEALDTYTQDVFNVKNSALWRDFCKFCDDYFENINQKLVPMGRYGLVLLIKNFGPVSLKYLSKGKLVYMINLALRQNYLSFYKTFLIKKQKIFIFSSFLSSKLNHIKNCIVSVIGTFKSIHLSQLRKQLKKFYNLSINLQEFGYENLTELIQNTPELILDNQTLKVNETAGESIRLLSNFIISIVLQNQYSISLTDLHSHFISLMPSQVSWKEGEFHFLIQFIQRFCSREVLVYEDSTNEIQLMYKMDSEEQNADLDCFRPETYQRLNERHEFIRHELVNDDNSTDLIKNSQRSKRFANIRVSADKDQKPDLKDSSNSCLSSPSTPSNPE